LPADGIGGLAVVIRRYGHNLFFNHGYADEATKWAVDLGLALQPRFHRQSV